jgi:hypothetical protein
VALSAQMLPELSPVVKQPLLPPQRPSESTFEGLLKFDLNRSTIFDSEILEFVGNFTQISPYFFYWKFADKLEIVLNLKCLLDIQVTFSQENLSKERYFCHRLINCEIVVNDLLHGWRLTFVDEISTLEGSIPSFQFDCLLTIYFILFILVPSKSYCPSFPFKN